MYNTLSNVYRLEWSKNNVSKKWVCLEDLKDFWVKWKQTNKELLKLRRAGFLRVTCIEYPRGMKRFYHVLTPKGKQKLNEVFNACIPLSKRDRFYSFLK